MNIDVTTIGTVFLFVGALAFLGAFLILVSRDVRRRHTKKESKERMHRKWTDLVEISQRRKQAPATPLDGTPGLVEAVAPRPRLATR